MRWFIPVLLVACGPVAPNTSTKVTPTVLAGDASQLRGLMRGSVVNGGLQFDDAACAQAFATPGEIPADRFDAFAGCLATLELQPSAREDSLGDVLVMQHAPGFELQARIIKEVEGPRLTWIGFASRFQGDPDVPTITHAALESLRLGGDRNGPLDPAVIATLELDETGPNGGVAYSWFKVCLDASGAITKTEPFTTTGSKSVEAFASAIKTSWKFRPFVMRGQPRAVCSLVRMAYPPDKAPLVETLPLPPPPSRSKKRPIVLSSSKLIEGKRIAGVRNIPPTDLDRYAIQEAGNPTVTGSFRVCIDDTGVVESVLPYRSTGLAGYDARIIATMMQWKYSPYMVDDQAVPVCTAVTFIYSQNGAPIRVNQHIR
jgi:hypothetical protein